MLLSHQRRELHVLGIGFCLSASMLVLPKLYWYWSRLSFTPAGMYGGIARLRTAIDMLVSALRCFNEHMMHKKFSIHTHTRQSHAQTNMLFAR